MLHEIVQYYPEISLEGKPLVLSSLKFLMHFIKEMKNYIQSHREEETKVHCGLLLNLVITTHEKDMTHFEQLFQKGVMDWEGAWGLWKPVSQV